jgi:hypothetical protein
MSKPNSVTKASEFEVMVRIKVHDPARVVSAARVIMSAASIDFDEWVEDQDEVDPLEAAMYWLIEPCVEPKANGFEVVDQTACRADDE